MLTQHFSRTIIISLNNMFEVGIKTGQSERAGDVVMLDMSYVPALREIKKRVTLFMNTTTKE